MSFLKSILASIIGFLIVALILVLIGFGIIAKIASNRATVVEENSILQLDFSDSIKDYIPTDPNPLSELLPIENQIGFNQLIKAIKRAQLDPKIKGISISDIPYNIGWAQITELRNQLKHFKSSGKKIWAYKDFFTQKDYYLASVANTVTMSPVGKVELNGLHSEVLFFKDFQEKFGVKMEIIRHGKYKSAVEPFIANKMSDANRYQINQLIQSLWKQITFDIQNSRNINTYKIANNLLGELPKSALENGLIDTLSYEDDYEKHIKKSIGSNITFVSVKDYIQNDLNIVLDNNTSKVAIIYAQGDIIYGEGNPEFIGQELINEAFAEAVKDDKIKAIVLRINSPGGSALASDLIWNAIEKAKKEKPVVVTMGNLAASGGYYIACNADHIFAEPTTITGSIGVFGMLPNVSEFANKNGIRSEIVSTHNNNSNYSVVQPINTQFKSTVTKSVEFIYDTFLERVAKGRNLNVTTVDSLAQGRVWTGIQARDNGLVDKLGGLDDAIFYAVSLAKISEYTIEEFPKYKMDFKDLLLSSPFLSTFNHKTASSTNQLLNKLKQLEKVLQMEGIQTRVPFDIVVE